MNAVDGDLHHENEDGAVKGKGIYKQMYSIKEYQEGERCRMVIYLEDIYNKLNWNWENIF